MTAARNAFAAAPITPERFGPGLVRSGFKTLSEVVEMVEREALRALGVTVDAYPYSALHLIAEATIGALQRGEVEAQAVTQTGLPVRIPPRCWRDAFDDDEGPPEYSMVTIAGLSPVLLGGAFGAYRGLTASIDDVSAQAMAARVGQALARGGVLSAILVPVVGDVSYRERAAQLDPKLPEALDALKQSGGTLGQRPLARSLEAPRTDPQRIEARRKAVIRNWSAITAIWKEWR